jgi:hypothetical protein
MMAWWVPRPGLPNQLTAVLRVRHPRHELARDQFGQQPAGLAPIHADASADRVTSWTAAAPGRSEQPKFHEQRLERRLDRRITRPWRSAARYQGIRPRLNVLRWSGRLAPSAPPLRGEMAARPREPASKPDPGRDSHRAFHASPGEIATALCGLSTMSIGPMPEIRPVQVWTTDQNLTVRARVAAPSHPHHLYERLAVTRRRSP